MRQRKHPEIIYTTKVCSKCGIEKPLSDFNKSSREIRGVVPSCKKCCCRLSDDQKQKEKKRDDLFNNGLKICNTCGEVKSLDKFGKNGKKNSGGVFAFNNRCKPCTQVYMRKYKKTDKFRNYTNEYRKTHPEIKEREDRNRKGKEEHIYEKKKQHLQNNPSAKIATTLRSRIWSVLRRTSKKNKKWFGFWEVVGCSPDELTRHLEMQFTEGMDWTNHKRDGWHIDHILPCASFDLSDPNQQKICFHYTNLQPLWWQDNFAKHTRILTA